jgi:hypothetical protein
VSAKSGECAAAERAGVKRRGRIARRGKVTEWRATRGMCVRVLGARETARRLFGDGVKNSHGLWGKGQVCVV